jgi:lysozyme
MMKVRESILAVASILSTGCGTDHDGMIQGVDVSHHQGDIDWTTVRKSGIQFAYIKATEGDSWLDTLYRSNLREARAAGLLTGSYHFFSFCKSGSVQAANFLSNADFSDGELVPVLDVETAGNCRQGPGDELYAEVKVFLDSVEAAVGIRPLIYTTTWFHLRHMDGMFEDERFWMRNLWWRPNDSMDWVFWQYAVEQLPGVQGDVDKNWFAFDRRRLEEFRIRRNPDQ